MFDQRGELPLLPFGNPLGPSTLLRIVSLPFEGLRAGLRVSLSRTLSLSNRSNHFVPASRGGVYMGIKQISPKQLRAIESAKKGLFLFESISLKIL